MANRRLTRVNELLKRELADALYRDLRPGTVELASVTITHVEVTPNLRRAHVSISVTGGPKAEAETLNALRKQRIAFQEHLHRTVKLKYTPTLEFKLDHSLAEGDRILQKINELLPPSSDEELHDADPSPPGDPRT